MGDDSRDPVSEGVPDPISYDVGYGKPPKHGQFLPGRSGNPSGRPRGAKNLAKVVLSEARKPVRVNGPDGARTVTKAEASVMQLANNAARGDLSVQRQFFTLLRASEESMNSEHPQGLPHESDQTVMQSIMRRLREYNPPTETSD